jgi:hypothetical protein
MPSLSPGTKEQERTDEYSESVCFCDSSVGATATRTATATGFDYFAGVGYFEGVRPMGQLTPVPPRPQ